MMDNKPTISVNIIVKNEEARVARAINSVKPFANEIIVIDTGSEDGTAALCTRLGCEVYFHSWEDDFSKARNQALDYSTSDWIFIIDADEVATFAYEDLPLDIMSKAEIGGVNIRIANYLDKDNLNVVSKHRYTRFFRNDPDLRFVGRIHEQIREAIESKYEIYEAELTLEHYGYKQIDKEKLERNARLLEKDLENEPDDWKRYHLAETHFTAGNKDEALQLFETVLHSPSLTKTQTERVCVRLGQLYLSKDDYSAANEVLGFVSEDVDTEGLRKYILAAVMLSLGDVETCLELYNSEDVKHSDLVDKSQLSVALEGAMKFKSIIENQQ